MKSVRWLLLSLLFAASVINYIDRQTLSILARTMNFRLFCAKPRGAVCVTTASTYFRIDYRSGMKGLWEPRRKRGKPLL